MANVHTFRDIEGGAHDMDVVPISRLSDTIGLTRPGSSADGFADQHSSPEVPKCIHMFLPGFRVKTFILGISGVQIIFYIISLCLGSYALAPVPSSLDKMGDSYGPAIQDGQVWRLVTPIFLHANIWHLFFNLFFQMRMGFGIEAQYGILKMVLLYFASGIGGNLLSVAWAPCKRAVGASTAGFGLIGIQIAEVCMMWHFIQRKDIMLFNIAFFVLITMLMVSTSVTPTMIDWRGHLGGFACGAALGFILNRGNDKPSWCKYAVYGSYIVLGIIYVSCSLVMALIPMDSRC